MKKNFKTRAGRLLAMAMAACLSMALAVPAFAADASYEVFQIFTGNYAYDAEAGGEVLSDIMYGSSYKGGGSGLVSDDIIKDLHDKGAEMTEPVLAKYIMDTYVDTAKPYAAAVCTPKADGKVAVTGIVPGYYAVRQVDVPDGSVGTTFIAQVSGDSFEFMPKDTGDLPVIDKTADNDKISEAAIGDEVGFTITVKVPANVKAYDKYYVGLADTMSKGLDLKDGSIAVADGAGADVTGSFYKASSKDGATGETSITVGAWLDTAGVEPGEVFTVSYTAVVNSQAATGTDPNTNKVVLTYSNNPSDAGKPWTDPTTPPEEPDVPGRIEGVEGETKTYVSGLTVTYFRGGADDKDDMSKRLPGARFQLSGTGLNGVVNIVTGFEPSESGTYYKLKNDTYTTAAPNENTSGQYESTTQKYAMVTSVDGVTAEGGQISAWTDGNGQITFKGLGVGAYTLHQETAVAGLKTAEDVPFEITFDKENLFTCASAGVAEADEWFYIDISGDIGLLLPETGGIGVYVVYAAGAVLVALAAGAIFLMYRKKSGAAK